MARYVVAEVQCVCGKWMNIRFKQIHNGERMTVGCWNCSRSIEFNGTMGYIEKQKRPTRIVSDEVRKS